MERIRLHLSDLPFMCSGGYHLLWCVLLSRSATYSFCVSAFFVVVIYMSCEHWDLQAWRSIKKLRDSVFLRSHSLSLSLSTLCIPTSEISCCWSGAFWKSLLLTAICQKTSRCIYTPTALYQNSRVPAGVKLLLYTLFENKKNKKYKIKIIISQVKRKVIRT